jgi:DNA-binding PadR family transcriptional regulator
MSEKLTALTDFDPVLHSPARLTIVAILATLREADFLFLLNETELSKGNLSVHLRKLEEPGYVEIEKTYRGKIPLTLCRLTDQGHAAFAQYREQMRRFVDLTE